MGTLKPYTGTPAVNGWTVTFGTARLGRAAAPPSLLLAVPTAHQSTASVPTSYYSILHYS